jgi:hypothetical protein
VGFMAPINSFDSMYCSRATACSSLHVNAQGSFLPGNSTDRGAWHGEKFAENGTVLQCCSQSPPRTVATVGADNHNPIIDIALRYSV